jgi:hypothetical protein
MNLKDLRLFENSCIEILVFIAGHPKKSTTLARETDY